MVLNPPAVIAGLTSLLGSFVHNILFEIRKYNFLSQVA